MPDPFLTDLAYSHSAVNGDMPTVSGIENLRGALIRRFLTIRGSYAGDPSYGASLPNYQNEPINMATQKAMFNDIREQAELDPRVVAVRSISFQVDNDKPDLTQITVKITPIGGEDVEFSFRPFQIDEVI